MPRSANVVAPGLERLLDQLFPGAAIVSVEPLGADRETDDETLKAGGYGVPVKIRLRASGGDEQEIVWHTAAANEFGHDRRSDRAQELLLAFDTFDRIPGHVRALDVGAVLRDGQLASLRGAGEFYLLTSYAPGTPYAEDLRRVALEGTATALDVGRCDALASYLAALHTTSTASGGYTRAVRDLVGHGEGIFGIVDAYPPDVEGAPPERLRQIERRAVEWRWRLRGREGRLARIHGDFHPFNVLFADGSTEVSVLDASRGCAGDPADDVTCMALNYVFFALPHPTSWRAGLGSLWRRFWRIYLGKRPDGELLEVAPPFLAWRALVMCCPRFYPDLDGESRGRLLSFAERALAAERLDPDWAEELFA
jgi:prepilin-type processing-associated H-X9-DG protein